MAKFSSLDELFEGRHFDREMALVHGCSRRPVG